MLWSPVGSIIQTDRRAAHLSAVPDADGERHGFLKRLFDLALIPKDVLFSKAHQTQCGSYKLGLHPNSKLFSDLPKGRHAALRMGGKKKKI